MKVSSARDAQEIERKYGVMKMLAGGQKIETQNLDLRILEIKPNTATSKHHHLKSESIFYILYGKVEMEINDSIISLQQGDVVVVEPGETHLLKNTGNDKSFVIEAMSPPFTKTDIYYSEAV